MSAFNNQLIYKPANGGFSTWRICVSASSLDDSAYMHSFSARVEGGKEVETPTHITAGKQGRTPYEQAMAEAESKFKTKLRKGYTLEKAAEGARAKNTLGFDIAVKAQKWAKVNHQPPYLISPKLDGHHMSAAVEDGTVILYSMNSKIINLPHIQVELQRLLDKKLWNGIPLDGELYLHGKDLDEIKSLSAGKTEESLDLEFHVYDLMHFESDYNTRLAGVEEIWDLSSSVIAQVETIEVHTPEEVQAQHDKWIALGYEGTMIRWGSAGYADVARSKYVLKKKDYQDAEFEVVGWELGKPKVSGGSTYQRPILVLKSHNGKIFRCNLHGSMHETDAAHQANLDHKFGAQYTVKFFKFTKAGVPSQPVGLRWRNDL